jgi:hypothetical protein
VAAGPAKPLPYRLYMRGERAHCRDQIDGFITNVHRTRCRDNAKKHSKIKEQMPIPESLDLIIE